MNLSTSPYKGARDFYPEDKRLQKYLFKTLRSVVETYGYEEYDAPILEPTELYLSKGNQEIIDEQTYTFTDRGGRSVTIRTEMTPTVSRMVAARRQELSYPLRWYSIPNMWRYERMQRGRLREFWQLNVDIFGVEDVAADLEIIQVADAILKKFGAKSKMYQIRINSRKLIDYALVDLFGLGQTQLVTMTRLIDRRAKLDPAEFKIQLEAILTPAQRENGMASRINQLLAATSVAELPTELQSHPSTLQLQDLALSLRERGIDNAIFDITLMRGFDYYSDIVFEVFDTDPDNNRAMFGGGRYSGLVELFGAQPLPVVGFGMGDVTLQNFLTSHNLLPKLVSETELYIVPIGEGDILAKIEPICQKLRSQGVRLAIDITNRKIDKKLKSAVKKQIAYALFIGEGELASGSFKLRDLVHSSESNHGLDRIVSIVKDRRSRPTTSDLSDDQLDLSEASNASD